MTAEWPDTTGVDRVPRDNPWQAARWLAGRYPRVQRLVERLGAVDDEADGDNVGRWVDVDKLADTLRAYDSYQRAWDGYQRSNYLAKQREDETDADYYARADVWEAAGPAAEDHAALYDHATPGGVRAYGTMSSGEKKLLRILATIGNRRVEFCTQDLNGLDDEGHAFVRDWARVLLEG